jgi:hypothetical protein
MDPQGTEIRQGGRPELADSRVSDAEEIRLALARAVATRQVSDQAIASVAKRLAATKLSIRGIDICTYGICVDYFFSDDRWAKVLPDIVKAKGTRVHTITVFPWGIPFPDIFRVRIEQEFDEFARGATVPLIERGGHA